MDTTTAPPARRAPTRRRVLVGAAIGLGGALALVLLASQVLGMFGRPLSSSDHEVVVHGEHVAVVLTVPGGLAIDAVVANPDGDADTECRGVRYEFGADLTVEAFASDCAVDGEQRIINGRHGVYRTLADVPDPVEVAEVATGVGPAQVFVQRYGEYTNVSDSWDEPVAIVTLDDPVDAEFPTLVLRSDKAALSREELTAIVSSLEPVGPWSS
ncbi:hypothetical protein LO763_27315 [Glycomyces sp. A-F 0318]|uniref:hypothetical protein n=1 Tax=Glycomyces amatae TaxID=2881355 RepID=UPI001E56CE5E|nr:hypothetical protein [Glycomyces amatae]MCD0447331.1 hypothetical protein [Glycomyces amatae]